jgi:hypothetical protein
LALGVDDLSCFGSVPTGILNAQDSVPVDDHGGLGVHGAVGNIDDLCVRDGERLGCGTRGQGKSEQEASEGAHQIIVPATTRFGHELDGDGGDFIRSEHGRRGRPAELRERWADADVSVTERWIPFREESLIILIFWV